MRTQKEKEKIVQKGLASKTGISKWCRKNKISPTQFYSYARQLGYIEDGKRTEKCFEYEGKTLTKNWVDISAESECDLVQVPIETILGTEMVEVKSRSDNSGITVVCNTYSVEIKKEFSAETLRRVLEVLAYA